MWWQSTLLNWGCIPELTNDCLDMTNASSAYLGIAIGAVIGGVISWLIYSRQEQTSNKQDYSLKQIKAIAEHLEKILKRLEDSDKRHDKTLNTILELDKRIDLVIEKQESLLEASKRGSP
jgi:uncharacterized membrane protein YgaE (UPF0421/DUF939 family)